MGQTMPSRLDLKSLNQLKQQTGFTKQQIRDLYRGFREISEGKWILDREHFDAAFSAGGVTPDDEVLRALFNIFDKDGANQVNFKQFLTSMSIFLTGGTLQDTLEVIFHLYDVEGRGHISKEEMVEVLTCFSTTLEMKELSGENTDTLLDTQTGIKAWVDQVFKESDITHNNQLTYGEFSLAVSKHPLLKDSAQAWISEISKEFFVKDHSKQ